jgi:hypothetical protein
MAVKNTQLLHRGVSHNLDSSLPSRQQEQISCMVPADLVDFNFGLVSMFDLEGPGVDKADHIFLVSNSNALPIRAPADIDVLPTCVDLVNTLSSYLCVF